MSENTKIEWTDHTWNPWEGCQKVGPGCDHCYAETRNQRFGGGVAPNWGPGAPRRRTSAANWRKMFRWNAAHAAFAAVHGRRQRVFCASLADVFDTAVPIEWLIDVLDVWRQTPHLDKLVLTKRIGNATKRLGEAFNTLMLRDDCAENPLVPWLATWIAGNAPADIWLGATVVNQAEADRDIPKLLRTPAKTRFLSMEPLLGHVDVFSSATGELLHTSGNDYEPGALDWIIVGGESAAGARPMHPAWARSLRDQCATAGVPYLFKQWGHWHTAVVDGSTGKPTFREFASFQQWVSKAQTWVAGGICLDRHGVPLECGEDFMRARDAGSFPVTVMHAVGKKASGRLLDGVVHDVERVADRAGFWKLTQPVTKELDRAADGVRLVAFSTTLGMAVWARHEDVFRGLGEPIALCVTSPPYPLRQARAYGNPTEAQYVDFLCEALEPIVAGLVPGGSIVLNVSNDIFEPRSPARSLYIERLTLALHDRLGLSLMGRVPWVNYSKPPGPTRWACVEHVQLTSAYEPVLWFTNDPACVRADNRQILQAHTERHQRLIAAGGEQRNAVYGDGAYRIRQSAFGNQTAGRLPRNVIERGHSCSDTRAYRRAAQALGLPTHGAMQPTDIPDFFTRFLSEPGDLVVDPFGGTIRTGLAAERLGRRWIATEWILQYARGAAELFRQFDGFQMHPAMQWATQPKRQ